MSIRPRTRGSAGARTPVAAVLAAVLVTLVTAVTGSLASGPASAAPPSSAPATVVTRSYPLSIGGFNRSYTLISPASGAAGKPMVVFLSGTSADTASEVARDHLLQFVAAGLVSLVYPIGIDRQWNVGGDCCTAATTPKADDQTYVRAVTRVAVDVLHPDVHKIYLIGYSSGGKLGWQIVCANRGPFAAYASYGANPETACAQQGLQLPVFIGFGAADTNEPIAGRPSDRRGVHPPAVLNLTLWVARDGCSARRYHRTTLQGQIYVRGFVPCAHPGLTVQFAVWEHSTHTIPQLVVNAPAGFGPVAWQFVSRFTRS